MTKEELYNNNKFLIYKVIKDLGCRYRTEEEFQEYIFYGQLGLLRAINGYNADQFSSSAFFYTSIKNSIMLLFKMKTSHKRKMNYMVMESLDAPIKEEQYYTEFHEVIPDETVHIEEDILKQDEYETLYKAIDKLKPTHKEIICKYFGIKTNQQSLNQIAKQYGVTRQAVAVKKDNAIKELRRIMKRIGGIDIEK